jgi:CBS domain containing-hemolysin-like protein
MLLLVDEHGGVEGLVTMRDVLEEILNPGPVEFEAKGDRIA